MTEPLYVATRKGLFTLERASVMTYRQRKHEPANRFRLSAPQKPLSTLPQLVSGGHMTINENGVLLWKEVPVTARIGPAHQKMHAYLACVRLRSIPENPDAVEGLPDDSLSLLDQHADLLGAHHPAVVAVRVRQDRPDGLDRGVDLVHGAGHGLKALFLQGHLHALHIRRHLLPKRRHARRLARQQHSRAGRCGGHGERWLNEVFGRRSPVYVTSDSLRESCA